MTSSIGAILPLAIAIGISPFPIVAIILALLSPTPKSSGITFTVGWLVGMIGPLAIVVLVALALDIGDDSEQSRPVLGAIRIALGLALVVLAFRQWRGRPKPDDDPHVPGWLALADNLTPMKSALLGVAVAAINPKGLFITIAAGLALARTAVPGPELIVPAAAFVLIASAVVFGLLAAYLAMPDRMDEPLNSGKAWLIANNSVIMTIILLLIGAMVISKGLHSF